MEILVVGILSVALLLSLAFLLIRRRRSILAHLPGRTHSDVKGFIFGEMASVIFDGRQRHFQYAKLAEDYGPICRLSMPFGEEQVLVSSPKLAKEVLVVGNPSYRNSTFGRAQIYDFYIAVFGRTLANTRGEDWRRRRNVLNPAFHAHKINAYLPFIVSRTNELVEELTAPTREEYVEVDAMFTQLTLEVICQFMFGEKLDFESIGGTAQLSKHFGFMQRMLMTRAAFPFSKYLPLQINKDLDKAKSDISSLFKAPLLKHKANGNENNEETLLGLLAADNTTYTSADLIFEELIVLLFAGHDTTAHTLAFAAYLLAKHPEKAAKARQEIEELIGGPPQLDSSNRFKPVELTPQQLSSLAYVGAVFKETQRLFPIAPEVVQQSFKDVTLGDYFIPANTPITIGIRAIQRDTKTWGENALEFEPERFFNLTPEQSEAFIPFSIGPHVCIGQNLAFLEGRVFLTYILYYFDLHLKADYVLDEVCPMVVAPKNAIPIKFIPRRA